MRISDWSSDVCSSDLIPFNTRTTQHGAGKAQRLGTVGIDHPYAHQALLPDTVIGQQRFVFVHASGETIGEVFYEVQQRTRPRFIHGAQFFFAPVLAGLPILRTGVRQIAVYDTRTIIGGVNARTRYRFIAVLQVSPFAEAIQNYRHGSHADRTQTKAEEHTL